MHGEQFLVAAGLDDAFAGVVNHDGALLGLFEGVAADVDQSFDNIVEGVVVVVVDNQFATVVVKQFDVLLLLFFVFFQFKGMDFVGLMGLMGGLLITNHLSLFTNKQHIGFGGDAFFTAFEAEVFGCCGLH